MLCALKRAIKYFICSAVVVNEGLWSARRNWLWCFGGFFFFFKHKYQEILLTERKYIVHRSCKGAFSILFSRAGQSEEMESVTSPTAHSYFSTLWHFYAQLNHQMCLFFKQWHSLRKSSWIMTLCFIRRGSQLIRSHSEFNDFVLLTPC